MKHQAALKRFVLSNYIYALVFLAGAVAFFYPLATSTYNHMTQTHVISNYQEELAQADAGKLEELQKDAEEYNRFIASLEGNVTDEITQEERALTSIVYMNVLVTGEAIATISIPKIDVELPIYRGSSEEVLNAGIGHLERSSLPVGGLSTHAVLTGHRGLPSSHLFRDLNYLTEGDVFFIYSLGNTIAYEVESTVTVLPHQIESLRVQEGRDLCTLVTCDPYMVNSHRLLVTGHRISQDPAMEEVPTDQISFFQKFWEYFLIIGVFSLLWLLIVLTRRSMKKRKLLRVEHEG